jgi:hypothetical protein
MSLFTQTENGALAVATVNPLLTLFYRIGAARSYPNILQDFQKAIEYDELKALAIVLYSRCIRGRGEDKDLSGQGERKVPRELLHWYLKSKTFHSSEILPVLTVLLLPKLGRWDDLTCTFGTQFEGFGAILWANAIKEKNVLAAKWADRSNRPLQKALKLNEAGLRKLLSSIRKQHIVEYKICEKNFDAIEYGKLPSLAGLRYSRLFQKWDAERYSAFIDSKETTVNAKVALPHEVYMNYKNNRDSAVASKFWEAMPALELIGNIMVICDTSGSMCQPVSDDSKTMCIDVSVALGTYIAQHNTGYFKNKLLTFSTSPTVVSLPVTKDIGVVFDFVVRINWGGSTDFQKCYELILSEAKRNNVAKEGMPSHLICLSDMQFNEASRTDWRDNYKPQQLHLDVIRRKFEEAGYDMPILIFWNLRTSNGFPASGEQDGVVLCSGFSPDIMKTVVKGETINPLQLMEDVITPFVELLT